MAINLPHFSNLPLQDSWAKDLLPKFMEGYQAGKMPEKMRDEAKTRALQNAILNAQAEHLPKQYESQEFLNKMQGQKLQSEIENAPADRELKMREAEARIRASEERANLAAMRYAMEPKNQELKEAALNAKIEAYKTKAQVDMARLNKPQPLTKEQRNANALFPEGSPENKQALAWMTGSPISKPEGLPKGAVPMYGYSKQDRAQEHKKQREMQETVNGAHEGIKIINEMEAIAKKHPDMSNYFEQIFANPENNDYKTKLYEKFAGNKDKLTAIQVFDKLSNDLILKAGTKFGAHFTDAKLKAIQRSKPSTRNTHPAKMSVLSHMKEEFEPYVKYGKELRKVREMGDYAFPFYIEDYMPQSLSDEELDEQLANMK